MFYFQHIYSIKYNVFDLFHLQYYGQNYILVLNALEA